MKNRWIALYVENQVGVLAKVSGLFSGTVFHHPYNLPSTGSTILHISYILSSYKLH